jgi:hypothetical protein
MDNVIYPDNNFIATAATSLRTKIKLWKTERAKARRRKERLSMENVVGKFKLHKDSLCASQ